MGSRQGDRIAHSQPWIGRTELRLVRDVLCSGYLSRGARVQAFERAMAQFVGVEAALGTASGTAALHLALLVAGVRPGDEVVVPSYVCSAVANAVRYCGAKVILADCVAGGYVVDVHDVARRITPRTAAVVAAHLFGQPADLPALRSLLVESSRLSRRVPVLIEDATQALGAWWGGVPVGRFGDLTVLSFYATKLLCTGTGGMLLGPHALVARARDLAAYDRHESDGVRYSYDMNELAGALGLAQLARYPQMIRRRQLRARRLYGLLARHVARDDLPPSPPRQPLAQPAHVYYRFVVTAPGGADAVCTYCQQHGVEAKRPIYLPLHRLMGMDAAQFPQAERAHTGTVSLPLYPTISVAQLRRVSAVTLAALARQRPSAGKRNSRVA